MRAISGDPKVLACISDVYYYITTSPKQLGGDHQQETAMTTRTSSKLAALAIALVMNSLMMGGIAYLFNAQLHQNPAVAPAAV